MTAAGRRLYRDRLAARRAGRSTDPVEQCLPPGTPRSLWSGTPILYEIELIPAEVDTGGMFAPLHEWLDERIASGTAFGFFRPYDRDRGGVAPERWHLSYAPIAQEYLRMLTPDALRRTIESADMRLKDEVLARLDEVHGRFVTNTGAP
jgi:hypothetical protein